MIPESIPWLESRGRHGDALKTLQKIGRINGRDFDDVFMEYSEEADVEASDARLGDLFRMKNVRRNTVLMIIVW